MQPSSIFLSEYAKIFTALDITDQELGVQIAFPFFHEDLILKLLDETLTILKGLSLIYELESDIYIVGDLHGNIRDLIRILRQINFFDSEARILFLGDYVDRGDFSVEVITLLFSLICQYPNRIYLIRGNHEFSCINMTYGFKDLIKYLYNNDNLWIHFNTVFNYLPIAAIIDKNIFCVHGGISSHLKSIYQIETLERPIVTFQDNDLLSDLMWSDPNPSISYYLESERGYGSVFGQDAILEFCREKKMNKLIRAHQCVKRGIENVLLGKVITVFSCSNYCDSCKNMAGYLYINHEVYKNVSLEPLDVLKREKALFIECLRKSVNDDQDSIEILHNQNLNLMGNSLNTGIKTPSKKLAPARKRSSFSQSYSRAVPIPLAAVHMGSTEQFFNRRPCTCFNRASHVFMPRDSDSDHEAGAEVALERSTQVKCNNINNLPPIEGKSNIPQLSPFNAMSDIPQLSPIMEEPPIENS